MPNGFLSQNYKFNPSMIDHNKTNEELILELNDLQSRYDALKASIDNQTPWQNHINLSFCQNENKNCIIAEHTSDTIAVFDLDLNMTYVSPSVISTNGFTQTEAILLKPHQIVTPDSLLIVNETLDKILPNLRAGYTDSKQYKPLELKQYKKNGTTFWTEVTYSFLKDNNNQPIGIVTISRDISNYKKAEKALRESEARFKTLSSVTSEGLMIHENGIILDANQAFAHLLGYETPEELIGMNGFEMVNLTSESTPNLNGHLRPLGDSIYDVGIITLTGQIVPTEIRGIDITYNDRNARLIFFRDITKRKQEENKLRHSLSLLDASLESTADGILIVDMQGNISKWNHKFVTMWGFTEEIMVAHNDDYLIKSILEQLSEPDIFTSKVKYLYDHPDESSSDIIHFKDGRIFERYSQPQRLGDEILGRVWSFRDISERIKSQGKITMLAHAVRSISECVSITDMQDITLFVNNAFLKTYGFEENEILGKSISIIRSANNPSSLTKSILPDTIGGGWHGELINVRKDGTEFPVYLSTSIIRDDEGNPIALIGVANDITERKQAELELIKAKEKAEESDRLKSAFLANMSHEIRTPMNGILGFADLLRTPGLNGKSQQEYLSIIEKSGNRMLSILNDIIDLSKIESGQTDIHISETNVNSLIESVCAFFKPQAEEKGISLSCSNHLHLKNTLMSTDKDKLYAILSNLVNNAIKYSKDGVITFGYSFTDLSDEFGNPTEIKFYVKDMGIGIPKNRQQAIFERFIQADITDNKALQGAGLGLSISKAYVEMLNGKIWVESEHGKGSVFYFTLPLNANNHAGLVAEDKKPLSNDPWPIRKLKILIAEDDEMSRQFMIMALSRFDAEIIQVKTGEEAIEACRLHEDIDLVLMDIKMPEMSGYEATQHIRQFNKEVIIIAQTAFAFMSDKEKAFAAGCNDYISKPMKIGDLLSLIQRHVKKAGLIS